MCHQKYTVELFFRQIFRYNSKQIIELLSCGFIRCFPYVFLSDTSLIFTKEACQNRVSEEAVNC